MSSSSHGSKRVTSGLATGCRSWGSLDGATRREGVKVVMMGKMSTRIFCLKKEKVQKRSLTTHTKKQQVTRRRQQTLKS